MSHKTANGVVDVNKVLSDIRTMRSKLFEMAPMMSPERESISHRKKSPLKERERDRDSTESENRSYKKKSPSPDSKRDRDRERAKRLSSSNVLRNKGTEIKKAFLFDSELSSNSDSLDTSRSRGKETSNTDDVDEIDIDDLSSAASLREQNLQRKLNASRNEIKKHAVIEKEFQEVGEGLRKLAIEREAEVKSLENENSSIKAQLKAADVELRSSKAQVKSLEKEEQTLRNKTTELEAKLTFEQQRASKLLDKLKSFENNEIDDNWKPKDTPNSRANNTVKENVPFDMSIGDLEVNDSKLKEEVHRAHSEISMHKEINLRQQKEIERLERQIDLVKDEAQNVKEALMEAKKGAKASTYRVRETQEDVKGLETELRKGEEERVKLENEKNRVDELCSSLRIDLKNVEEENKSLRLLLQSERNSKSPLLQEIENLKVELNHTRESRDARTAELRTRNDELSRVNDDRQQAREALTLAETELTNMAQQMDLLTTEVLSYKQLNLEERLMSANDSVKVREREIQDLKSEIDKVKMDAEKTRQQMYERGEIDRANHLDALFQINEEKSRLETELRELVSTLNNRDHSIQKLQDSLEHAKRENRDLSLTVQNSNRTIDDLQRRCDSLSSQNSNSNQKFSRVEEERDLLIKEVQSYKAKLDEMMNLVSSRERHEGSLHERLRQLEDDVAERNKEIRRAARTIKLTEERCHQLQEELNLSGKEKDRVVTDLTSELERSRQELSTCAMTISSLEDELKRARKDGERTRQAELDLRLLERDFAGKVNLIQKLEHELRVRGEEVELLEKEVYKLQASSKTQEKETHEIDKKFKDLSEKQQQTESLLRRQQEISTQRGEDSSQLQHNVSQLTSKLRQQMTALMKIQSQNMSGALNLSNISNISNSPNDDSFSSSFSGQTK